MPLGIQRAIMAKLRVLNLEHADFTPADRPAADDLSARAPGEVCAKCHQLIQGGQAARRRGQADWVHDMCA